MHIHIEKGQGTAKFYIDPVDLVKSKRFKANEISEIRKIIQEKKEFFINKWNEHFNN